MDSHATMGAMERANQTLGEMLRTMKHATQMRVGGRLETDHPLVSWMIRHCCWIHRRCHVRADGRTPLMKFLGTTVTEVDLPVLAKSCGARVPCPVGENGEHGRAPRAATSTECASSGQSDDCPSQPNGEESTSTSQRVIPSVPSGRL